MADDRIPTEEEITQLPRLARIAFAARCARRVQPLFQLFWPTAPRKYRTAVAKAIDLAETAGTGGDISANAYAYAFAAADAADAARAAAAAQAAKAAVYAARAVNAVNATYAYDATDVALVADTTATSSNAALIRRDFELLRSLAMKENWDDQTPVRPEVFGPMWPEGAPKGWPEKEAEKPTPRTETEQKIRGLALDLLAQADSSPEALEEGLVRLYTAANQYHMARGGGVLTPDSFQQMISSLVPAGRD